VTRVLPPQTQGLAYTTKVTPYQMQWSLDVQREVIDGTVATIGYAGSRGIHQRDSDYNALQASLDRRFTRNVGVQASYTWSRCIDETGRDRGRCNLDRSHNFTASSIVELPLGFEVSGIISAVTGAPFSPVLQMGLRPNLAVGRTYKDVVKGSIDRYFDPTAFTVPVAGTLGSVGRNVLTGPGYSGIDLALIKNTRVPSIAESFNVQFRAEFFNLLNHINFGQPNTNVSAPTAGQIRSASAARQIQFALKLLF
jgi:hypothetical protein